MFTVVGKFCGKSCKEIERLQERMSILPYCQNAKNHNQG